MPKTPKRATALSALNQTITMIDSMTIKQEMRARNLQHELRAVGFSFFFVIGFVQHFDVFNTQFDLFRLTRITAPRRSSASRKMSKWKRFIYFVFLSSSISAPFLYPISLLMERFGFSPD